MALGLLVAGCSSDDDVAPTATTPPQGTGTSEPAAPDDGGNGSAAPMPTPGGGLSVPEARTSEASGPLLVHGFLIAEGGRVRLCEAVAESFPPQCGGAFLEVRGLDLSSVEGLSQEGDVRWVEGETSLLGEREGDVLVVTGTSI